MLPHKINMKRSSSLLFIYTAFFAGTFLALFIQCAFIHKYGSDISSIINLGTTSREREAVIADYGPVYQHPGIGHDGIPTYIIARDPFLEGFGHTLDDNNAAVPYRYRRILFSLLGGGFGAFSPLHTLYGLIGISSLSLGITAAALAYATQKYSLSIFVLLAAYANFGAFCALNTLTCDVLALALGTISLVAFLSGKKKTACFTAACAALTKEVYVLIALSQTLIYFKRGSVRAGIQHGAAALLPLSAWIAYLHFKAPFYSTFAPRGNLAVPFSGILASSPDWIKLDRMELFFVIAAIMLILMLSIQVIRQRSFTFSAFALPWICLLLSSGSIVWDLGNNIARAASFLWILFALNPAMKSISGVSKT